MKNNKKTIKKVILNSIQDLQRLSLSLNSMRGRSRIKYGMTALFNNGGFTLIELLVVVLIIGILAAVAVPQYKKAIVKSKTNLLRKYVEEVSQAAMVYRLQNGKLPVTFPALDMDLPLAKTSKTVPKGQTQNIAFCDLWTTGYDPVRIGDDFEIVLSSSDGGWTLAVVGTFTKGPYSCAGFYRQMTAKSGISPTKCFEDPTYFHNNQRNGIFCNKIVKSPTKSAYQFYPLP